MSATEARASLWQNLSGRLGDSQGEAGEAEEDGAQGVWGLVSDRIDPTRFRPRLAPDIEIRDFHTRWGTGYAMVANPRDLVHYRLTPEEAALVRQMDGSRTIKEIVVDRFRESGDLELANVVELVRALEIGNFLDHRYVDTDQAVMQAMDPISRRRQKAREFSRTLSVEWENAERLVNWLYEHGVKWFFHPLIILLSVGLMVGGLVAFVLDVVSHRFGLSGKSLAIGFLVLLALDYFMVFVHELGHAVVLVHYGRRVKSAGFMIYFGSPAFFIESSDVLMLDRSQRMTQALAGAYGQMIVGAVASVVPLLAPGWIFSPTLYKFAVIDYFVVFMNLIPLLELDGYFILTDLIQVPDLRKRSLRFLQHDLWHKALRRTGLSRAEWLLLLYAVLGVAFTIFSFYTSYFWWREIFGSLVSRLWHGGPVTRILLFALGAFVAGPIVRGLIQLVRSLLRKLRLFGRRIRFRLERSWRVEAAELIDALPSFDDVDEDALSDLAGQVRIRTYAPGQPVVRQGDRPEAFYVVRRGVVEVVEEDPITGKERLLRTLGRGDSFGEVALLQGSPRTATVRPMEEAQLFEVAKGTFEKLLADHIHAPQFGPSMQAVAELRELPCFAQLDSSDLSSLLDHGGWVTFPPGEAILEEGGVGDAFYAIRSGQVEVHEGGEFRRTIGPGSYFGEIALLLDVPRTATVRARTPTRLFKLSREGFDRLVGDAFRRGALRPHAALSSPFEH